MKCQYELKYFKKIIFVINNSERRNTDRMMKMNIIRRRLHQHQYPAELLQ